MIKLNNLNIKQSLVIIVYVLVGLFVILKGGYYMPDSYAFLDMSFNRSPLYSSFLKLFTSVFGSHYEIPVIIVQYGFTVFAIQRLLSKVSNIFKLNLFSVLALQGILLAPCMYLHFTASSILSEALAYPMVILVFLNTYLAFKELDFRPLYRALLWLFFLILTRGQFLVFVPIIVLTGLGVGKYKRHYKPIWRILILAIALPFITNQTEKVYNKIIFGYYTSNAMSNVHLISSCFYNSNASNATIFTNEDAKAIFKTIYTNLEEDDLLRSNAIANGHDDIVFFEKNFTTICNNRVHELGLAFFANKGYNYYEQNIALNELYGTMIFPLMKANASTAFAFYLKNFKNTFGTTKQLLLLLMLLLYGLYLLYQQPSHLNMFVVLVLLFMFFNNGIIALAVHPIKRYLFYFDWAIFAIILLLLNRIPIKTKK